MQNPRIEVPCVAATVSIDGSSLRTVPVGMEIRITDLDLIASGIRGGFVRQSGIGVYMSDSRFGRQRARNSWMPWTPETAVGVRCLRTLKMRQTPFKQAHGRGAGPGHGRSRPPRCGSQSASRCPIGGPAGPVQQGYAYMYT